MTLSQAQIQYSDLSAATWGNTGDTITYDYDDNGSLTSKETDDGTNDTEHVDYEYNLQGRLDNATTTTYTAGSPDSPVSVVEYTYNTAGIRTGKYTYETPYGGGTKSNEVTTDYLIDPANHTGYAQVLEETTDDGIDITRIQYTIGDDVISQTVSTWDGVDTWTAADTQYLLYDGHGSTRQLADPSGTVAAADNYSYDAYGVMLSDGSGADAAANAGTSMLYAGEQYDPDFSGYYNRARYYNPSNGRFNRTDPYAGSPQDPQGLHKYAYCHNNPVNGIDPSGLFTIVEVATVTAITATLFSFAINPVGTAKFFAKATIGLVAFLQYLFSATTWTIAFRGIMDRIVGLMKDPAALLTTILFAILSKISVIFSIGMGIWSLFKSRDTIKGLFGAGLSINAVAFSAAVLTATLIITFVATLIFGKILGAAKKSLRRPYLRKATRAKIEAAAKKAPDGSFLDGNTGDVITGKFHYGHKFGYEHRRLVRYATKKKMSQPEFNNYINDHPEFFQIEDTLSNMSHAFEKPGIL